MGRKKADRTATDPTTMPMMGTTTMMAHRRANAATRPSRSLRRRCGRLTRAEYNNTVRDLLGDTTRPADAFPPDETVMGFAANADTAVAELDVEYYVDAAEALAETHVADVGDWLSCDPGETTCVQPWLEGFGRRAFRRPLTAEEGELLLDIYEDGRAQWGAAAGLELAIATVLASPQFLYHVELGTGEGEAAVPLRPYEMASRLAYFVWGTMPDDDLLDAAEDDALATPEEIDQQARRMMDDPRFADAITSFHEQWLEIAVLDNLGKDPTEFPQWSAELADAAQLETMTFVDEVIRNGDATLQTLLTAPFTYVDADLAALYGVPAPSEPFERIDLDPSERAGLLTQVGFLAAKSHELDNSWVYRGRFVRSRLLCEDLPPPPPDIDFSEGNNADRLEDPMCRGCHVLMDPIGMGMDDYDPIGRYADFGATGEIQGSDIEGEFEGAVELAERLVDSAQVRDCVAETWSVFANRREPGVEDQCSVSITKDAFAESGGDIRELIIAIATSDAFRYRSSEAQ